MHPTPQRSPPGFKELIRITWSLIRPNRVLNLGGGTFGGGTCLTPNIMV